MAVAGALLVWVSRRGIMKSRLPIFVAVVILLAIPSAACSKTTPETVEDILSQAADVKLVKYDCIFPGPTGTQITKVWVKENKMRVELTSEGQTVQTYLLDMETGTVYMWHSPENIPQELGIATGEVSDFVSAMTMARGVAISNPMIIGTETTDGKECLVVECVYGDVNGDLTTRAWIWKEHKFLVRYDIIGTERTHTIEFKNIDFGDIPDSMFELPEVP